MVCQQMTSLTLCKTGSVLFGSFAYLEWKLRKIHKKLVDLKDKTGNLKEIARKTAILASEAEKRKKDGTDKRT